MGSLIEVNGVRGIFLSADEFDSIASVMYDLAAFAESEMILERYVSEGDPVLLNVMRARIQLRSGEVGMEIDF
jgi:hypothetical protein